MTTIKCTLAALAAMLTAAAFTVPAQAAGPHGAHGVGPMGAGHMAAGHMGVGHIGDGHFGHGHHHFRPGFGLGIYAPVYAYDYGDCYRVYRYHHWRTVCD